MASLEGKIDELTDEVKGFKKSNEMLLQELQAIKDHEIDNAFVMVSTF